MPNNFKFGVTLATAAAALLSMGVTLSTAVRAADEVPMQRLGVDSCKGMGWLGTQSDAESMAAGGTVAK